MGRKLRKKKDTLRKPGRTPSRNNRHNTNRKSTASATSSNSFNSESTQQDDVKDDTNVETTTIPKSDKEKEGQNKNQIEEERDGGKEEEIEKEIEDEEKEKKKEIEEKGKEKEKEQEKEKEKEKQKENTIIIENEETFNQVTPPVLNENMTSKTSLTSDNSSDNLKESFKDKSARRNSHNSSKESLKEKEKDKNKEKEKQKEKEILNKRMSKEQKLKDKEKSTKEKEKDKELEKEKEKEKNKNKKKSKSDKSNEGLKISLPITQASSSSTPVDLTVAHAGGVTIVGSAAEAMSDLRLEKSLGATQAIVVATEEKANKSNNGKEEKPSQSQRSTLKDMHAQLFAKVRQRSNTYEKRNHLLKPSEFKDSRSSTISTPKSTSASTSTATSTSTSTATSTSTSTTSSSSSSTPSTSTSSSSSASASCLSSTSVENSSYDFATATSSASTPTTSLSSSSTTIITSTITALTTSTPTSPPPPPTTTTTTTTTATATTTTTSIAESTTSSARTSSSAQNEDPNIVGKATSLPPTRRTSPITSPTPNRASIKRTKSTAPSVPLPMIPRFASIVEERSRGRASTTDGSAISGVVPRKRIKPQRSPSTRFSYAVFAEEFESSDDNEETNVLANEENKTEKSETNKKDIESEEIAKVDLSGDAIKIMEKEEGTNNEISRPFVNKPLQNVMKAPRLPASQKALDNRKRQVLLNSADYSVMSEIFGWAPPAVASSEVNEEIVESPRAKTPPMLKRNQSFTVHLMKKQGTSKSMKLPIAGNDLEGVKALSKQFEEETNSSNFIQNFGEKGDAHIEAASIIQLIKHFTSINDSDTIDAFFLTYRSYLNSSQLLALLTVRYMSSLTMEDAHGVDIGTQTLEILCYWIRYYIDDFTPELLAKFEAFLGNYKNEDFDQESHSEHIEIIQQIWEEVEHVKHPSSVDPERTTFKQLFARRDSNTTLDGAEDSTDESGTRESGNRDSIGNRFKKGKKGKTSSLSSTSDDFGADPSSAALEIPKNINSLSSPDLRHNTKLRKHLSMSSTSATNLDGDASHIAPATTNAGGNSPSTFNKNKNIIKSHKNSFYTLNKFLTLRSMTKETTIEILTASEELLAKEICLIDQEGYNAVSIQELRALGWTKEDTKHKAECINVVIDRFNLTTAWTCAQILSPTLTEDNRVRMIGKFIRIANQCFEYQNIHSGMAIMLGLQKPQITRLKRLWKKLSSFDRRTFRLMESFTTPLNNFGNIRKCIDELVLDPNIVGVPFIGIFLADMVFNAEIPDFVGEHKLVNFHKHLVTARIIRTCTVFQLNCYDFSSNPAVRQYLSEVSGLRDEELWAISLDLQPRGSG